MSYQTTRNTRRESRTLVGRFRGGKLNPVMAVPVRGNEGGLLSQSITYELDPIAGRMVTPITGELISVFVPVQAIDAIKNPAAAYAGMTEVLREKILSGNPLFGLETEGEISKRCGINPRSIGGQKKVNEMVRLAHNAAVNFLRQSKYVKASQLLHSNTAITPALISQTVLERMNGVLDPEDRVNGMVQFDTGVITAPLSSAVINVDGLYYDAVPATVGGTPKGTDNDIPTSISGVFSSVVGRRTGPTADAGMSDRPRVDLSPVGVDLSGLNIGSVSLTDFYNAETQDRLTRVMRKLRDDNPQYGDEIVLRWAHGLNVENGKIPFVISQQRAVFGRSIVEPRRRSGDGSGPRPRVGSGAAGSSWHGGPSVRTSAPWWRGTAPRRPSIPKE